MLVTGLESDLSGFDESNKLKLYVCQTSEDELMRLSRSNEETVQFVSPYSSFIHRGRQNQQQMKFLVTVLTTMFFYPLFYS